VVTIFDGKALKVIFSENGTGGFAQFK